MQAVLEFLTGLGWPPLALTVIAIPWAFAVFCFGIAAARVGLRSAQQGWKRTPRKRVTRGRRADLLNLAPYQRILRLTVRYISNALPGGAATLADNVNPKNSDQEDRMTASNEPVCLGQYYTPEQVSELTRFAPQTLANWRVRRARGETVGPEFVKVAGRIRYLRSSVDAFMSGKAA